MSEEATFHLTQHSGTYYMAHTRAPAAKPAAVSAYRNLLARRPDLRPVADAKLAELDALAKKVGPDRLRDRCFISHVQREYLQAVLARGDDT